VGHGAIKPREANKSAEGKARNRRVEIILIEP
jgi:outer membrane protein OmpA-like peptidoglycan-associated protein